MSLEIDVDRKTIDAALAALGLHDVPVYRARWLKDGTVELTTRFGVQTWKPEAKAAKRFKVSRKKKKREA